MSSASDRPDEDAASNADSEPLSLPDENSMSDRASTRESFSLIPFGAANFRADRASQVFIKLHFYWKNCDPRYATNFEFARYLDTYDSSWGVYGYNGQSIEIPSSFCQLSRHIAKNGLHGGTIPYENEALDEFSRRVAINYDCIPRRPMGEDDSYVFRIRCTGSKLPILDEGVGALRFLEGGAEASLEFHKTVERNLDAIVENGTRYSHFDPLAGTAGLSLEFDVFMGRMEAVRSFLRRCGKTEEDIDRAGFGYDDDEPEP